MSTLQEIKAAIAHLDPREKAILTAELFAMESSRTRWNWKRARTWFGRRGSRAGAAD